MRTSLSHPWGPLYTITTSDFDEALYCKDTCLKTQDEVSPIKADILAIKESLEFVKENRGNGTIPIHPVVSLFTCYENNYHICTGKKKSIKFVEELKAINKTKSELSRWDGDSDHVKILWIPVEFKNMM